MHAVLGTMRRLSPAKAGPQAVLVCFTPSHREFSVALSSTNPAALDDARYDHTRVPPADGSTPALASWPSSGMPSVARRRLAAWGGASPLHSKRGVAAFASPVADGSTKKTTTALYVMPADANDAHDDARSRRRRRKRREIRGGARRGGRGLEGRYALARIDEDAPFAEPSQTTSEPPALTSLDALLASLAATVRAIFGGDVDGTRFETMPRAATTRRIGREDTSRRGTSVRHLDVGRDGDVGGAVDGSLADRDDVVVPQCAETSHPMPRSITPAAFKPPRDAVYRGVYHGTRGPPRSCSFSSTRALIDRPYSASTAPPPFHTEAPPSGSKEATTAAADELLDEAGR